MKQSGDSNRVLFEYEVSKAASQIPGTGTPIYPAELRAAKVEGQVIGQFVLNEDGKPDVGTFKALNTANQQFVAAVKAALPQMRFYPAESEGRPVKQLIQQAFLFRIE